MQEKELSLTEKKSIEVTNRFFEALDTLIEMGKINSEHGFCVDYNVNRRNFKRLREEPHRKFFLWVFAPVVELGVSGDWILTGKGKMFK